MFRAILVLIALAVPHAAGAQVPQLQTITRIAFASCFDQRMDQPTWDAMFAYRPQVFIAAGDNVYGDVRRPLLTPDLPVLADAYRRARELGFFHRMMRQAHLLAVWDDHDFGLNDGGADMPYQARAKELFLDFFDVPANDPRRTREGIYHAEILGPPGRRVQVILLDTRSFRSPLVRAPWLYGPYVPTEDRATTILGEAQWAWLAERLREPAELRLIVSSIQIVADGHGWERWGNFPHERERFYRLIRETRASGVVVLSGDRHLGAIYREPSAAPYPIIDITASPISRPAANNTEPGPNRIGAVYGAENFGTVDIDWWERRLTVSVRSLNGEPVRRIELTFDALQPRSGD